MCKFIKLFVLTLSLLALTACGGGALADRNSTKEEINVPPLAKAKATPVTVVQGDAVIFDASGSSDSDGTIVSYLWKDGATTLSKKISFTISTLTVGSHNITLIVKDNDDAVATDNVAVIVENSTTKQLKKTGQTKSYDENGTEVTDGNTKDDGYYQKGVEPSYTRDDATNIVTDHITGLEWADDDNVSSVKKPWLTQENYDKCIGYNTEQDTSKCLDASGDTAITYCKKLTLGGYADWRLPSLKELQDITNLGTVAPAIEVNIFKNVASDHYWTYTNYESIGHNYYDDAWGVNFFSGYAKSHYKTAKHYVRCVRDGQ